MLLSTAKVLTSRVLTSHSDVPYITSSNNRNYVYTYVKNNLNSAYAKKKQKNADFSKKKVLFHNVGTRYARKTCCIRFKTFFTYKTGPNRVLPAASESTKISTTRFRYFLGNFKFLCNFLKLLL